MNARKCLEILKQIKDVAFATVDKKGNPQVRIIDIMLLEDEKLYFCTARGKEFYTELKANTNIAITAMNKNFQMIRLNAIAKKQNSSKLEQIFYENPSLNEIYPNSSRNILEIFCIKDGMVELFDLSKSPLYRKSFSFGNYTFDKKGFLINDECTECGVCKNDCPQDCIEEASPYLILDENCLHCGICYENCPSEAIERLCFA